MITNDEVFEHIGDIKGDIVKLKMDIKNTEALKSIKENLNKIYTDAECTDICITENTDKPFFGIIVMPIIDPKDTINIVISDDTYIVKKYKVEIDSKLMGNYLGLSLDEIESLLLHEVGVLVINDKPIKVVRYIIDGYLHKTGELLKISNYISYIELLTFGIKNAMRKSVSVFYNDYFVATELDEAYSLDEFIQSAVGKIKSHSDMWVAGLNNVSTVITWVLRLYKDILTYRIRSIYNLKRGMELTGSKYEKIDMSNLIRRLERIDDESLIHEGVTDFLNKRKEAFDGAFSSFKRNGIKGYFDDLYDIEFEVNNMDDDRALALSLLHRINSRMSVIDDYIMSEEKLSTYEVKKLQELYNKYDKLRAEIASKKLTSPRTLVINYDESYDYFTEGFLKDTAKDIGTWYDRRLTSEEIAEAEKEFEKVMSKIKLPKEVKVKYNLGIVKGSNNVKPININKNFLHILDKNAIASFNISEITGESSVNKSISIANKILSELNKNSKNFKYVIDNTITSTNKGGYNGEIYAYRKKDKIEKDMPYGRGSTIDTLRKQTVIVYPV